MKLIKNCQTKFFKTGKLIL